MCGRFHFGILPDNELGKKIKQHAKKLNLVYAQGEIFPSDNVLCIIPFESKINLDIKKWGIQSKSLLINARMETLDQRITFSSIKNNRCAVICNGFYEWDLDKKKYYITFDKPYMYLGCIFNEKNELVILTQSTDDEQFKKIHDRQPFIMDKDEMLSFIHNEKCVFKKKQLYISQVNEQISIL